MTTKIEAENKKTSAKAALRLRWVLAHEPVSVFETAARRFGDIIRQGSGGGIEVDVISATQFNQGKRMSPAEVIAKVASGEIEMCQTYTTALAQLHEPLRLLDLPFLFKSHEHSASVLDGPIGEKLMSGLLPRGLRGLSFTYSGGYRVLSSAGAEIHGLKDLKGLRVRCMESPVATHLFESWGAIPVPAPLHETVDLARAGKIDAAETTYPRYWDQKQPEVHRVVNETHHSLLLTMMVVNEKYFQGLSPANREMVRRAAGEAAKIERATSISEGEQVRKRCPENGIKIVELQASEKRAFETSAKPVVERFAPVFGESLIRSIRDAA